MYLFKELETYNKAVRLITIIEQTTKDFPKATFYFVNRIRRSAEMIQQNIARAHEYGNEENKKNYYWRVRGSIQECFGMIEVASRQGFISSPVRDDLRSSLDDLNRRVQATIRAESTSSVGGKLIDVPVITNPDSQN